MPFPAHALLEFGGTLATVSGTFDEVWSCGVRVLGFNDKSSLPETEIEGFLDALVSGAHGITQTLPAWFSATASGMSTNAKLTHVKLNNIGPDGKYMNTGTTHVRDVSSQSTNIAPVPSFLSLAFTWETDKTRGRAHRGRIYPPNGTYNCNTVKVAAADRDKAAAAGQSLIKLINDAVFDDAGTDRLYAVVASRIDGTWNPITGVSCDDIYDVQRRRKNAAKPARSAVLAV